MNNSNFISIEEIGKYYGMDEGTWDSHSIVNRMIEETIGYIGYSIGELKAACSAIVWNKPRDGDYHSSGKFTAVKVSIGEGYICPELIISSLIKAEKFQKIQTLVLAAEKCLYPCERCIKFMKSEPIFRRDTVIVVAYKKEKDIKAEIFNFNELLEHFCES